MRCGLNRKYFPSRQIKMERCFSRPAVFSGQYPRHFFELLRYSGRFKNFPSLGGLSTRKSSTRIHIEKPKDLYGILGVSPAATQQQVKEAYYKLSLKYHPDRNMGSENAHKMFTELTEAYSIIGQYESRKKYDRGLLQDYPRRAKMDP